MNLEHCSDMQSFTLELNMFAWVAVIFGDMVSLTIILAILTNNALRFRTKKGSQQWSYGAGQAKMGLQDLKPWMFHQSALYFNTNATKHSERLEYLSTSSPTYLLLHQTATYHQ